MKGYLGFKLHKDGQVLYEIRRDVAASSGKLKLGRRYYVRPRRGVSAPVTSYFEPYSDLGIGRWAADMLRVLKAELKFRLKVVGYRVYRWTKLL
jgi:hypothetical protein